MVPPHGCKFERPLEQQARLHGDKLSSFVKPKLGQLLEAEDAAPVAHGPELPDNPGSRHDAT
jgi:hypothetical protein